MAGLKEKTQCNVTGIELGVFMQTLKKCVTFK